MTSRRLSPGSFLVIIVFSGFMTSLQARVNGELTRHVGNGVQAALISFTTGLILLTLAVTLVPSVRTGVWRVPRAVRGGKLPLWATLGGFLGGAFIACQSYSTALVGVALFSVGVVAGQIANSLAVDRVGLSPIGKVHITPRRGVSAVLAVCAVVLSGSGRIEGAGFSVAAVIVAFLGGCLVPIQQALNGRVNVVSRQPVATTWFNFVFGTLGLSVGVLLGVILFGARISTPTAGPWWMYLGGTLGLIFIITAAWAVPRYGVLVFALVSIAGQLASALILDLVAPIGVNSVQWTLVAGTALTFIAVGIGALGRR